jgi:hypothetical protein
MEGSISFRRRVRQPARRKSQFRNGERRAVKRALTGARIRLGLPIEASSLTSAAQQVGSTASYVEAAIRVLQAEDPVLLDDVLAGRQHLPAAAGKIRRRAELIAAYRRATLVDRAALGSTVGVDHVFDETIVPSL